MSLRCQEPCDAGELPSGMHPTTTPAGHRRSHSPWLVAAGRLWNIIESADCTNFVFQLHDLFDVSQEPRIDVRAHAVDLLDRHPKLQRISQIENAFGVWNRELALDVVFRRLVVPHRSFLPPPSPKVTNFQAAKSLLQRLTERAADRHRFPDGLHLHGQCWISFRELFESPARNLCHDVVDRRLKTRQCFASDIVWNLVEPISNRQLRRDLGDWKPGRLRCQSLMIERLADSSRSRSFDLCPD
jgi:hypothetical protein